MNYRKILKRFLWILLPLTAVWFLGDYGYSVYVDFKLHQWESGVTRDANGVLEGCAAYSTGQSDTAVLLVHGINDTPYTWRKVAPVLAESFHVRAMRMPGFGERLDVCASKTDEDWIRSVEEEARKLRASHKRVFVVAHSLGGAVTIQAALRATSKQSELFDGVILLAPAIEVSNRRSPILPTRMWHRISGGLIFTDMTYNPFGNDCKDPDERDSVNRVPFSPRSVIDHTFRVIDANRGRESEFMLPVLVVLSKEDQVNDHEASQVWLDKVGSSKKQVYWNNQSGHALQYDLGWKSVTDQIQKFIQSVGDGE